MKKSLIISLLFMMIFCTYAQARTAYDKYGRIIKDNSIRGQKQTVIQKAYYGNTAAAAKLDYDKELKALEDETGLKSNYYQKEQNNLINK